MIYFLLLIISLLPTHFVANEVYLDVFHLAQDRLVLNYEKPIDLQQSLIFELDSFNDNISNVEYKFNLYGASYRRYIKNTSTGVFYSFGFRAGMTNVNDGEFAENEVLTMPFYDIGVKAKLSENWYHVLKLEAGYVMLFTNDVDVNSIIGLQFIPYFSFGYNL